MIVHYQSHLIATELLPEYTHTFRFNSITRKDHISFVNHQDDIALTSSTGGINTTAPASTGIADNFKVTHSLADSFKKSIKRDASIFTTFKEGKYRDTSHRNTISTTRARWWLKH